MRLYDVVYDIIYSLDIEQEEILVLRKKVYDIFRKYKRVNELFENIVDCLSKYNKSDKNIIDLFSEYERIKVRMKEDNEYKKEIEGKLVDVRFLTFIYVMRVNKVSSKFLLELHDRDERDLLVELLGVSIQSIYRFRKRIRYENYMNRVSEIKAKRNSLKNVY